MNRYINADALKDRIHASPLFPNFGEDGYFIREFILELIDEQATADVAREIIADLVKFADDKERQMSVHGHSVWYIDADDVTDFIAELKKKYTEGG